VTAPRSPLPAATWLSSEYIPFLPHNLAVGWSGGADSTALLLALKQQGYHVHAWHVDHGWRDASAHEATTLSEKAAAWGIPFISARLQPGTGNNREAEARNGRYAQFQLWQQQFGISTLCLAHQQDDQAETVCMRLLQGAGPGGCRGMWRERQFHDLRIVRPLLHITGQDLRQALQHAGIDWLEDPSNRDMRIWRNHIRHQLFPAIAQTGVSPEVLFLRWQRQAERVAELLDAGADILLQQLITHDDHEVSFPWQAWLTTSPAIRARVLQKCMAMILGEGSTPGRRHITLVETWTQQSGLGGLDLSRCRISRRKKRIYLTKWSG